jgi:thioredoxin 2
VTSTIIVCDNCGKKNRVPAAASGIPRCGNCHRPLPWIVDAGDDDFAEIVDAAAITVVLDLWAPWCGPCRMVSPALERLAHQYAGRVKLVKVDVDRAPRIAQRFSAQSIPTLLVLRGGKVVGRQVGAAPEETLRRWLDQSLATADDAPASSASSSS